MKLKKVILLPKDQRLFHQIGENIKLARKRGKFTTNQVSERAGIYRATLYRIEKGYSSVTIGLYYSVFKVLNLQDDFHKLGTDDVLGRKLQDLDLLK